MEFYQTTAYKITSYQTGELEFYLVINKAQVSAKYLFSKYVGRHLNALKKEKYFLVGINHHP